VLQEKFAKISIKLTGNWNRKFAKWRNDSTSMSTVTHKVRFKFNPSTTAKKRASISILQYELADSSTNYLTCFYMIHEIRTLTMSITINVEDSLI
jgi:hypothetical protein